MHKPTEFEFYEWKNEGMGEGECEIGREIVNKMDVKVKSQKSKLKSQNHTPLIDVVSKGAIFDFLLLTFDF